MPRPILHQVKKLQLLPKHFGTISLFIMGSKRRFFQIRDKILKVFLSVNYVNSHKLKKLRTTPYRAKGNGSCERFNRTLISKLGTLPEDFKSKWTQHISTLVYAYNCTHSNAIGFSPYYLLYGRHPLLPIDFEFGVLVPELSETITYKYVQELKKRLENAFQKANAFCEKEAIRSKQHFDRTAKCSKLLPGDLVLVKKKGFSSKHKIADKWETEPYEIVPQRSDGLPVYTVMRNDRKLYITICSFCWVYGVR